jgi:hypothetical protein
LAPAFEWGIGFLQTSCVELYRRVRTILKPRWWMVGDYPVPKEDHFS